MLAIDKLIEISLCNKVSRNLVANCLKGKERRLTNLPRLFENKYLANNYFTNLPTLVLVLANQV